jgi:hypothetical protein
MAIKLNKTLKILKQAFVAKQNFIKTLIKIFGCYIIHESYSNKHKRSELEVYLDDPSHPEMDDDAFDIIAWWKLHGPNSKVSGNLSHGT